MRHRVNDFALKLANVNGTGSASANGLLMQAIFRMGIPVSGKNLFPSNIQGLPTWYEIRVNKSGYTARALDYDLVIAMNSQTYAKNIAYAGAVVALVGIDVALVADLLAETFARNEALRDSNQRALRLGYDYAMENLECPLPFYVEQLEANGNSILINGNMAIALGCLYAG